MSKITDLIADKFFSSTDWERGADRINNYGGNTSYYYYRKELVHKIAQSVYMFTVKSYSHSTISRLNGILKELFKYHQDEFKLKIKKGNLYLNKSPISDKFTVIDCVIYSMEEVC